MYGWTIPLRILLLYTVFKAVAEIEKSHQQQINKVLWKLGLFGKTNRGKKVLLVYLRLFVSQLCLRFGLYFLYPSHVCLDLCLFALYWFVCLGPLTGRIHHVLFRRGCDQCSWVLGRVWGVINIFPIHFIKPRIVSPRGSFFVSLWSQYIIHKHLNRTANQKRLPQRENAWLALTTTENKST